MPKIQLNAAKEAQAHITANAKRLHWNTLEKIGQGFVAKSIHFSLVESRNTQATHEYSHHWIVFQNASTLLTDNDCFL